MKVEALTTISGTYGFLHAGETMDMSDAKAEELIGLGFVKEFKGKVAVDKIAIDKQTAKVMTSVKEVKSKEEPSKAVETDPANATVEPTTGAKEAKNVIVTKEDKAAAAAASKEEGKK